MQLITWNCDAAVPTNTLLCLQDTWHVSLFFDTALFGQKLLIVVTFVLGLVCMFVTWHGYNFIMPSGINTWGEDLPGQCLWTQHHLVMPLIKPPRALKNVKCVKKVRDKNGDVRHDLKVLFDYVRYYLIVRICLQTFIKRRIHSGTWQRRRFLISRSCSWYLTQIMMVSWHSANSRASWEPWECRSRVCNSCKQISSCI